MELLNLEYTRKALEEYAVAVRNAYQDNLITNDHLASGGLLNNVECRVDVGEHEYIVSLTLDKYWKYVEKGLQGSENPSSPYPNGGWKAFPHILEWVKIKPVIPRPDAAGRIPRPESLAYLITRSIKEKGTKGTDDLQNAIDMINEQFKERIEMALYQDAQVITKVFVGGIQGGLEVE